MSLFLNLEKKLRNIWWVAVFFLVLAAITLPTILLAQHYKWTISIGQQALIAIFATYCCQLMRGKPLTEFTGRLNAVWFRNFWLGLFVRASVMLIPAFFLYYGNWITIQTVPVNTSSLLAATSLFIAVAAAEEFLFRGFPFQRLKDSIGVWGVQLFMAGYFLLIHLNNPGMVGTIKVLASVNIFLASIPFGVAFLKTGSLAMPIGLHFMANWVQGTFLGFGVSGHQETSILKPVFYNAPVWLTGGGFGLEASLPGLIAIIAAIISLYRWQPAITLTNH